MKELTTPPAAVSVSQACQIKNKLREMSRKAGATAYERIGLAAQLMLDREWIAAEHGGDQHAAMDLIQDEFFGDLCGAVSLAQLLKLHRDVPKDVWTRHHYNIQRVYAESRIKAKEKADDKPEREGPVPVKEHRKLQEEVEHLRSAGIAAEKKAAAAATEAEKLRRELAEKNVEIAELRGRVLELERFTNRQMQLA